jgi:hypothetical protein
MKAVLFASSPASDIRADLAFVNKFDATVAPGVSDDSASGYQVGSQWVIPTLKQVWQCVDATAGAADWIVVSSNEQTPGQVAAPAASTPTGDGGDASLTGGAGGATSGAGGDATLQGGAATAGNSNGGDALVIPGAKSGTGKDGVSRIAGTILKAQGAPAAITAAAVLTAAQVIGGLLTGNLGGAAPGNYQLPASADLDTAMPTAPDGYAFDFSLINISTVAAEDITITTNTGWTALVGSMVVASNAAATDKSSATFRARKAGAGDWSLYRLN